MSSLPTAARPATAATAAAAAAASFRTQIAPRRVVHRTSGRRSGPIRRLVSPSDLGERLKPFVFLDDFEVPPSPAPLFGMHPHSGIATLTLLTGGAVRISDTTGNTGELSAGDLEWMRAGVGAWHDSAPVGGETLTGLQLWVALPPALEHAAAQSQFVPAGQVGRAGPARVLLGQHEGVRSPIAAPAGLNYLHVTLARGDSWSYAPPPEHEVAWLYVMRGALRGHGLLPARELAVFEPGTAAIGLHAEEDTSFVLGSARPHPHPLVLGTYSVHTSAEALRRGEAEIARIGRQLRAGS